MWTKVYEINLIKFFKTQLMVTTVSSTVNCEYGILFGTNRLLIINEVLITLLSPYKSVRVEVTLEAAETETMIFLVGLLMSCSSI